MSFEKLTSSVRMMLTLLAAPFIVAFLGLYLFPANRTMFVGVVAFWMIPAIPALSGILDGLFHVETVTKGKESDFSTFVTLTMMAAIGAVLSYILQDAFIQPFGGIESITNGVLNSLTLFAVNFTVSVVFAWWALLKPRGLWLTQ